MKAQTTPGGFALQAKPAFDAHHKLSQSPEVSFMSKKGSRGKQGRPRLHGEDISTLLGTSPTPYDYIKVIRSDPDLADDFWYFNRAGEAYDFELTTFEKKNEAEYLTISARGVTHFVNGEAVFLTLNEWEREYKLYRRLKEINFFRQYKLWKNYSLWKNMRRRNMMVDRSQFLEQQLFILDDKLRGPLLEVRSRSFQITRWDLVDIKFDKSSQLNEFTRDQENLRERVATQLEDLENAVKLVVATSCRESMDAFKKDNRTTVDEDGVADQNEEAEPFLVGDSSHKQMPYTQDAITRQHYKRLAKFIRLCDYQIFDSKINLTMTSTRKVLRTMAHDYGKKETRGNMLRQQTLPVFVIGGDFDGLTAAFDPDEEIVKSAVDDAIMKGLTVVLNNEPLIRAPDFKKYTERLEEFEDKQLDEEIDLLQMAINDEEFVEVNDSIKQAISAAFTIVRNYSKTFLPYLQMYEENRKMNVDLLRTADYDLFKHTIEGYRKQVKDLSELEEVKNLGIFQLRTERIKSKLKPSPQACIRAIEKLLPDLATEKAQALISILTDSNRKLAQAPGNVDEYIVFNRHFKDIADKISDMETRFLEIKDLMRLMEEFHVKFGESNKMKFNEAQQDLNLLRQRITSSNERSEPDKIKFTKELREKIMIVEKKVKDVNVKLANEMLSNREEPPAKVVDYLKEIGEEIDFMWESSKAFNTYQDQLEMERTDFQAVGETRQQYKLLFDMWNALHEWGFKIVKWRSTQFALIDVAEISKEVDGYYRISQKSRRLEDQGNFVPEILQSKVEELKNTMPVVINLRDKTLKPRHWDQIRQVLQTEIDINEPSFTLDSLIELRVNDKKDEIAEIALKANKEEELERQIKEVEDSWKGVEFVLKEHKDFPGVFLLSELDDIVTLLEDTLVNISAITTSRFIGPIFELADRVQKKFGSFQMTLDEWVNVQKQFNYLSPIFQNEEITRQVKDSKVFKTVEEKFKEMMKEVSVRPNAVDAASVPGRYKLLVDWNQKMEHIQKELDKFVESKRKQYPRFYFLSNDELLKLVASTSNKALTHDKVVEAAKLYLRKVFENVYSLEVSQNSDMKSIFSAEGEELEITTRGVKLRGPVEDWFQHLEKDAMQDSVKRSIKKGFQEYDEANRGGWVDDNLAQVVSCVGNIMWTSGTEDILLGRAQDSMADWYDTIVSQLEDLTQLVRTDLTNIKRKSIVALVTQDVHNRDIVESLRDDDVSNINDFRWQKQLRFYWLNEEGECVMRQVNATLQYGYEYMGATTRLVITPLTDRCWLTITSALHIKMGAAPAGPAGTGKTESTKDLAKALGRYCVVFNCSEQVTNKMTEKLFIGLCSTGCWTCLDEFNRIDIEVLSVIAQQLRSIRVAKLEAKAEFLFEDKSVPLNPAMGVFITMNPGYAGRTELPDNLKVLFRPVSMMVPDYTLIAQIMLFAEGFKEAKTLSGKMAKLYKLCSEQLSKQDHYDFGMRAVKSVLNMAGSLKRKDPDLPEDVVLIRAMRDSNVPKFLKEDLVLFFAIVGDLFPGVEVPFIDYGELEQAIREQITKNQLQPEQAFIFKIIQLFETFAVRFGVMIVGPAASGKSTCYRTLAESMTYLRKQVKARNEDFQEVELTVLNPKSITMDELYGAYNMSGEWTDGLASNIMREYSSREDKNRRWVVFDGPVDALWIENMNTVLDDNQMLCLANSERIKLKNEMRMLFEVMDLAVASPATVSRCGMVYMNVEAVGWRPYVVTWIVKTLVTWTPEAREYLRGLFDIYIEKTLTFIRKNLSEPIPTIDTSLVMSLCSLVKALTDPTTCPRMKDDFEDFKRFLDKVFVFSTVWSLGGALDASSAYKFDNFLTNALECDLPKGSIYDSFVSPERKTGDYRTWDKIKPEFEFSSEKSFYDIVVPTKDTTRFAFLLKVQLLHQKPVFITGNTGVGKSIIIADTINQMKDDIDYPIFPILLTFSAQTSSMQTQNSIVSKLELKRKDLYGGYGNKKVVIMIDDVNMPEKEKFGAQPPIELMRQYCDLGFLYDRTKNVPFRIIDTTVVCCAAPPEGGRYPLTPRFTRHFHMLCIPPTSEDAMTLIFKSIVEGFFKPFKAEIQGLSGSLVSSTITLYNRMLQEMLPTPIKSHYTFNLRDVSKVFQGILMSDHRRLLQPDTMIRLWIHEASRVFHDRLINKEDRHWFTETIIKLLLQVYRKDWSHEEVFEHKPILFGDFLRGDVDEDDKFYEEAEDMHKLHDVVCRYLENYNMDHPSQMTLVFFQDALEHLTRICRILRQPRGNAMLVGVGGSGKQSLTKLAAYISHSETFQLQLSKDAGLASFKENLVTLLKKAGGPEAQPTVFLLTDTQILQESFLEDVNNILNSGEVPNLFAKEDLDQLDSDLRPIADKLKVTDSMYNFFVKRVRANLHVVLCMSPVGESLRVRMRMFPSLVNCCTVDWVDPWPKDALLSVSQSRLMDLPLDSLQKDEAVAMREALSHICVEVHASVQTLGDEFFAVLRRKVYITPKSYLDMIQCYFKLLEEKRNQLTFNRNRYMKGVDQLRKTNVEVEKMQADLKVKQPILEVKKAEAQVLMVKVSADTADANKVKEEAEEEERQVKEKKEEVGEVQRDAQASLDEAMPAVRSAERALEEINSKDITEIRSFSQPPDLVKFTLEAVAIMLGDKDDWDNIKKKTLQGGLLDRLKNYPRDTIPSKVLSKIKAKINGRPDFKPEIVGKTNQASRSLCLWVFAIDKYADVSKEVAPKRERLAQMNKVLEEANEKLKISQGKLRKELEKVADLQARLTAAQDEVESLDNECNTTKARLERASVLTVSLKDENERWQVAVTRLNEQLRNVIGDVFISAACISYYGPFTGQYRKKLVDLWTEQCQELKIPTSAGVDLQSTLGDPMVIRDWNLKELPSDDVSINNGIIVTRCERWPLMIDPQVQANKWIRNMERKERDRREIKVVKQNDKDFNKALENCLRNGVPLLLEDVGENLPAVLDPVLQKNLIDQGAGRYAIRIGDKDVDYDTAFRLYITTKFANPHYLPEICIKTTIINFTVTTQGLEEQLLVDVVNKEQPAIEQEKVSLMTSLANFQRKMKELEDKILQSLFESKGNILDDEDLIMQLKESKKVADNVNKQIIEAEDTKRKIEKERAEYHPVAERGSILYFVIADLALIDPMYQYSLTYFKRLFNNIIESSQKAEDRAQRLSILLTAITETLFFNVCRGLFNAHKLIFSFLIAVQILRKTGEIADTEWGLLLKGVSMIPSDFTKTPNPAPSKFTEKTWDIVVTLQNISLPFKEPRLGEVVKANLAVWEEWASAKEPHLLPLPQPYENVAKFHKLLLIKAFREEKVVFTVLDFVEAALGRKYVQIPPTSMDEVYLDTSCKTPIIFILSQGADPTSKMQAFARDKNFQDRLNVISLGQGQGPRAVKEIEAGTKSGMWIMLQNCHLSKSWMPELEKVVELFAENKGIHEDFRLYLTSMPADYFPVPVLQNGVKITNEPPKGIKTNVMRSLNTFNDEMLETSSKPNEWKKLLLSLCFFHAVTQERRKFGPLGWNIRYEFNESDLETSITMLKNFLEEGTAVPWDAIRFITGEINYGGRVTDDWDRRCLMSILDIFITPEALKDAYQFSKSGIYYIPVKGSLALYKAYTETLPLTDEPEIFGMHDNANITFQKQETDLILSIALSIQPRDTGGSAGGQTPDQLVDSLAGKILEGLPLQLQRAEAGPTTFVEDKNGLMDSLATFLGQELVRFNELLRVMRKSLEDLRKAIKGLVVMSKDLDSMYRSFLNNQVPEIWERVAYPSLRPLASWVADLTQRVAFLRSWVVGGRPSAFWLSAFYFPQGFLTAVLQSFARKYQIAIDILNFIYEMQTSVDAESIEDPPEDGCLVYGLYMEGAKWDLDSMQLEDAHPGEMYSMAPVILFNPSEAYTQDPDEYAMPVYKTSTRAGVLDTTGHSTNFIIAIDCPSSRKPNYWVLKGAAFLCQLND